MAIAESPFLLLRLSPSTTQRHVKSIALFIYTRAVPLEARDGAWPSIA
jgi:hypothetical protein